MKILTIILLIVSATLSYLYMTGNMVIPKGERLYQIRTDKEVFMTNRYRSFSSGCISFTDTHFGEIIVCGTYNIFRIK